MIDLLVGLGIVSLVIFVVVFSITVAVGLSFRLFGIE